MSEESTSEGEPFVSPLLHVDVLSDGQLQSTPLRSYSDAPLSELEYLPLAAAPAKEKPPPLRLIILVSIPMFMGYAVLIAFQRFLKKEYDIGDNKGHLSHEYTRAVSCVYLGNLIFRMAHNFIFAWIRPRNRVYIAMLSMSLSVLIIGLMVFELHFHKHLYWVYIAYSLGGVGIGTFESNALSAITLLGHQTKKWMVMGFPVGFSFVLIGGYILVGIGVPPAAMYFIVLGANLIGICIFFFFVPKCDIADNAHTAEIFIEQLKQITQWFPLIWKHCIALMLDMFFVSIFSQVMYYIYNGDSVPLFGPNSSVRWDKDFFFAIHNLFTLIGDSSSRQLAYRTKREWNPLLYLILAFIGAGLLVSKYAIYAPVGILLVFFCNGSVYALTTKYIDNHVPKRFNLIALSFWLFLGDAGSYTGSMVSGYMRDLVCPHPQQYMCTP